MVIIPPRLEIAFSHKFFCIEPDTERTYSCCPCIKPATGDAMSIGSTFALTNVGENSNDTTVAKVSNFVVIVI